MTLCGVMLLSGIVSMISMEGDLKKYVRLLCGLCLLCALITPLFEWSTRGDFQPEELWHEAVEGETEDYEKIWQEALLRGSEQEVQRELQGRLSAAMDLEEDSFSVSAQIVSKNNIFVLESVTVTLGHEAIFADPKRIISYVEELGDCRCIVVYE